MKSLTSRVRAVAASSALVTGFAATPAAADNHGDKHKSEHHDD